LVLKPGGLAVELTRADTLVGRHSDADVRLSLPDVSRRHCRFKFASGRWQVVDLNSLNGVFVNGEQVQQATLDHGDRVQIGGLTFEVEIGDGMAQAEPARPSVLRSIADALPRPGRDSAPPQRKAS
jgi:pSer/pThr/pTyr-binding forkhead associated (FHA) protein